MATRILTLIALLGASALNLAEAAPNHPVRHDIVEEIKLKTNKWTPKEVHENHLKDVHPHVLNKRLGSLGNKAKSFFEYIASPFASLKKAPSPHRKQITAGDKPKHFDAREEWPGCIHPVQEQGNCGSCWAFSSSGFLSDRFCIHTDGNVNVTLSPQDMVACDFENYGCSGGYLINSVDYLESEGIASAKCMPYQEKDTSCKFKCINETETYSKYYCKPGTLAVATSPSEI